MGSTRIDREKLSAAIGGLTRERAVSLLAEALDLVPPAKVSKLVGRYVELNSLRPDPPGVAALLTDVKAFEEASLAGDYYDGFNVNSKNRAAGRPGAAAVRRVAGRPGHRGDRVAIGSDSVSLGWRQRGEVHLMDRVRTAAATWRVMLPSMVDEDESPLSRALHALGAKVSPPRLDGYDFQLDGVAGHFILGEDEEADDRQDGPFTVCRMPLPKGGPVFVMDLRPQTRDELSAVARGDAIDVQVGDGAFDRTFVVEAAPSHIVRILLDDQIRSALLSLAPCRFASAAGHVSLTKWGTCTESELVARIVGVCVDFAKAVDRLPEELVRQRQSAGYRGERTIVPPEDEARAAEELAAVEGVRRTRRQIAGANVGLAVLVVIVAATMYELCTHG